MTSTVPRFGPTEAPKFNRVPFTFAYYREETVEEQSFNLLAKPLDVGAANALLNAQKSDKESDNFTALIKLITKYMDDKDGTGVYWAPVELAPRPGEDPPRKRFRGPDGKIHVWEKAEGFLAPQNGSSRRRWVALVDDDEASVDQEALVKLLEFVVEVAGKDRSRA